jgi:hypothetical protein
VKNGAAAQLFDDMRRAVPELPTGGKLSAVVVDLGHEHELGGEVVRSGRRPRLIIDERWEGGALRGLIGQLERIAASDGVAAVVVRGEPAAGAVEGDDLVPFEIHMRRGPVVQAFLRGRRAAIPLRSGRLLEPLPPGGDNVTWETAAGTLLELSCKQAGFQPFNVQRGAASLIGGCRRVRGQRLDYDRHTLIYAGLYFTLMTGHDGHPVCEVSRVATETPVVRVHAVLIAPGLHGHPDRWSVYRVTADGERPAPPARRKAKIDLRNAIAALIVAFGVPPTVISLAEEKLPPHLQAWVVLPVAIAGAIYLIGLTFYNWYQLRKHSDRHNDSDG